MEEEEEEVAAVVGGLKLVSAHPAEVEVEDFDAFVTFSFVEQKLHLQTHPY